MFPNAYPDDAAAAWEFSRMIDGELDTARRRDQAAFTDSLERALGASMSLHALVIAAHKPVS